MLESELAFLYDTARSMPPGATVVEIGSFKGRSSVAICEGLRDVPDARFVAVDPWRRKSMLNTEVYDEHDPDGDTIYERFLRNTAPYGFVTPMRTTSVEASRELGDASVDWIFIDGDHSFGAVRDDIRAWFPKVKRGGVISGHDHDWPSVRDAVASHFKGVSAAGAIWHLRKADETLPTRAHALVAGAALDMARGLLRRALRRSR
jgi:predicted O-methyltransferase YrrM